MPGPELVARRVLIAEDHLLIAVDLSEAFEQEGARIVGPVSTLKRAMALLEDEAPVHCAILDLNLADAVVYPLADALTERQVPLIFTTGRDPDTIPDRFDGVPVLEKPVKAEVVLAKARQLLGITAGPAV